MRLTLGKGRCVMAELGEAGIELVVAFVCFSAVFAIEFAVLHMACRLVSNVWGRWAKKVRQA